MNNYPGMHKGNIPLLCVNCNHQSRDHNRSRKQKDGHWNGKCTYPDCDCKLYIKPNFMDEQKIEKIKTL